MNQQKTIIALAVVVAILTLGIAYAAISNQTLTISGNVSASTSDANFNVQFTDYDADNEVLVGGVGTTVAAIKSTNPKQATIDVSGLTTVGQTATATFRIENASPQDVGAKLTRTVQNSNTTWYAVTAEFANDTLAKGATTTMIVSVRLLDTPVTDADITAAKATITVTIDAEAT